MKEGDLYARIVPGKEDCKAWEGGRDKERRPMFYLDGKLDYVTRHLWRLKKGPIAKGLVIRHTCHNRECVNIEHLLIGTVKDNVADDVARGKRGKGASK